MRCEKVLNELSLFLDGMLESREADDVSAHIGRCMSCRREWDRISNLRTALRSLGRVCPPDYLHHLVDYRVRNANRALLKHRVRDAFEYQWSRFRTLGRGWYLIRLVGTLATAVFFFVLSSAMNPLHLVRGEVQDRPAMSQASRQQQLWSGVLKHLGLRPLEAQKKPISPSDASINDLYFLNFGQNAVRNERDETLFVVTVVDRSGAAKIQDVVEYPVDSALLNEFNSMILSARWRPASYNGRAVDSHLVMTFSRISVYD